MSIDVRFLPPEMQRQIAAKLGAELRKENKYHAKKTVRQAEAGKIRFASKKEARRYDELMILLRAGEILDLRLQEEYTLQGAYTTPEGFRMRAIKYVADFTYLGRDGRRVVEDVKGRQTSEYKLKKKLMAEKLKITIKEV